MNVIFDILRASGMKFNVPNCTFVVNDIPYIDYVITQYGIKPDPNKVQGIMDIGQSTTTAEVRALICMAQYYRYMFPRQYHIFVLLT